MDLSKAIEKLPLFEKARFERTCRANAISLDYSANTNGLPVFFHVFEDREYSDYFPFYQKAVVVDVGAHYGYFSLFARINTGAGSRIISVEPDIDNFNHLRSNVNYSKLDGIELVNACVSKDSGKVKLYKGADVNNSIFRDFQLNQPNAAYQEVTAKTLEQVMTEHKLEQIDFLKLDCEGAEFPILNHCPAEVFNRITTISMEFHDMKDAQYTGNNMVALLKKNNYHIAKYTYSKTNRGLNYGKIIATKI